MIARACTRSALRWPAWPSYSNERDGPSVEFSVVIPVFNGAAFIAEAIWSVQTQFVSPLEIIVIDDASNDDTATIVANLSETDARITLIRNSFNRGPSFSRNVGLRQARASLVAFLDADDQWMPDHLEHLARAFQTMPSATVAYSRVCAPDSSAELAPSRCQPQLVPDAMLEFLIDNPIPQSAAAVRKTFVLAAGGYREDSRYAEDYDLWMRLVLADAQFVHVPRATVLRMTHADQISARHASRMFHSAWKVRRTVVEHRYGHVGRADASVVRSLLASEAVCIAAALNSRRRELLEVTMEATQWIPASPDRLTATRSLLGWRWHVWRLTARAYDWLPVPSRRWLKRARVSINATRDTLRR